MNLRICAGAVVRLCAPIGFALLYFAGAISAQTQPATVILVRHAEKAAEPKADPPLSDEGRVRVQALLNAVRHADVGVIYTTTRLRNVETARPLGAALGVPVIALAIEAGKADAYARDLAARIRSQGGGRVSLVVGHSNTFAPVIRALGGPDIEEIVEERYDDMFVVTIQDARPTRLIRSTYGKRWEPE